LARSSPFHRKEWEYTVDIYKRKTKLLQKSFLATTFDRPVALQAFPAFTASLPPLLLICYKLISIFKTSSSK